MKRLLFIALIYFSYTSCVVYEVPTFYTSITFTNTVDVPIDILFYKNETAGVFKTMHSGVINSEGGEKIIDTNVASPFGKTREGMFQFIFCDSIVVIFNKDKYFVSVLDPKEGDVSVLDFFDWDNYTDLGDDNYNIKITNEHYEQALDYVAVEE